MSEKILSQDEVEALLGAMKKGNVELDNNGLINANIEPFDLTVKDQKKRIKFTVLDEVLDRFFEMSDNTISLFLQKEISFEYVATEIIKFEEYITEYSRPTIFNYFTMDPLIGKAIMTIKPQLVMSLIDCMMGGKGNPVDKVREFTPLEKRLINKFSKKLLGVFERSWKNIYPLTANILKVESNPDYIHILSPSDNVVKIDFTIKGSEFEGNINFCISYLMLEPIKEKLSGSYLKDKEQDPKQSLRVKKLIMDAEIDVVAELGKSEKTISELINLKINDIIKLQNGPDDRVTLKVCGIPKYEGDPGIMKGNKAVEIVHKYK